MATRKHSVLLAAAVGATLFVLWDKNSRADTVVFAQAYNRAFDGLISAQNYGGWSFTDPAIGDQIIDDWVPLNVPQFRTSWGTLNSASLTALTGFTGAFLFDDGGDSSASVELVSTTYVWAGSTFTPTTALASAYGEADSVGSGILGLRPTSEQTYYSYATSPSSYIGNGTITNTAQIYLFIPDSFIGQYATLFGGYDGAALEAVTYDYTPATGPLPSNPEVIVGSGGFAALAAAPTGGYGKVIIALNGVPTLTSGTLTAAEIENQGNLSQSGGNLTLSGTFNQTGTNFADGNTTYIGGIYNISGGNATFGNLTGNGGVTISAGNLTVGTIGHSGIISQSGGTISATNLTQTGAISFDSNGTQILGGVYNLSNAGVATFGNITNNGVINQSGGNLTATNYTSTDSTYVDGSNVTQHLASF